MHFFLVDKLHCKNMEISGIFLLYPPVRVMIIGDNRVRVNGLRAGFRQPASYRPSGTQVVVVEIKVTEEKRRPIQKEDINS